MWASSAGDSFFLYPFLIEKIYLSADNRFPCMFGALGRSESRGPPSEAVCLILGPKNGY